MENEQEKPSSEEGRDRLVQKNGTRRKRRRQGQRKQPAQQNTDGNKRKNQQPDANGRKKRPQSNNIPIIVPRVQEPVPPCAICGKPIESIAQAIAGPQPEAFSHFDCVLRKIAEEEKILPHQKVSYIGRGVFAIVETDADGRFVFVKRIPYENPETFQSMKRYVEDRKR